MLKPGAVGVSDMLRERASRYAWYGALIAVAAVVLATALLCVHVYDGITIDSILRAHRENVALWILDSLPFLYAGWGQYASMNMARTAGSVIRQRTRALRHEMEEVQKSARLRTDFFARMSHELRTPLNAILGMSQLLLESDLERRQRRRVDVMQESARGLLTLINDVLDFSRMEAGEVELDEVEFNLRESLDGAVTLLTAEADRKGLELVSELPAEMPVWVGGDPGRLRQVVINLLGNAIKFTDSGRVTLRLVEWGAGDGGRIDLVFEVADTGPGIDSAAQENLFEPYSRVPGGEQAGTGLGLSITRELVQAMGGQISVDSAPGKGSVFRFNVNLREAEALDVATLSRQIDLQGVRVLLAEAPSQTRDALAGQLRALGIQVATADDGVDAMQRVLRAALERNPYDLVFADMFLPRMSGEDLGSGLLEHDDTRDTVIAMVTTAGVRGDARRLQAIGFSGYLVRPIPPEDLRDLVTALLAVQSLPAEQRRRQGFVTRHFLREHRSGASRVLLVEDSAVNREVTMSMLEPLGCPVDVARNGAEALELAAGQDYAVVLMDFQLPDLNGSRVIERIRTVDGRRGRVPVLVFTAGATDAEKRQCRQAGADGFLLKSVAAEELRNVLARYVPLAGGGAPAESAGDGASAATGGSPAPDVELVRIFLRESAERMAEMRLSAAGEVDTELFARHAHSLKSSSRYVTDGPLPDAAADLEEKANEGDVQAIVEDAFPAVESAWRRLREELQAAAPPATARAGAAGD